MSLYISKSINIGLFSFLGSLSQDDRSQNSVDSQLDQSKTTQHVVSEEDKKVLFAAGLKLLQRDSAPPIANEELSRIELSYIDKCKAMYNMYTTLVCACHNVSHPNLKGLLSHLRALRVWFPVFTCYHCMITFTDRSASTKHYLRCPRSNLETLVKLSNLKRRSEVKTRLYQVFKCNECRFLYSFHEDYCKHVDEEHSQITLPLICTCGRQFSTNEDYKDHVYVSCLVDFYCDICFITVKTLTAFKKHAAEEHDASEGFILRQDDNYRQRKSLPMREAKVPSVKREYTDEKNIISGKRRTSYKPIIDDEEEKVVNPLSIKYPGNECPVCVREYSTNANMLRHYRTHFNDDGSLKEEQVDNSIYCCPDCGGMFNVEEWELHKEMHKKKKCTECNKSFQFQSELEQHRSTHLNLKLYRDSKTQNYKSTMASPNSEANNVVMMCEVCDRMFTSKEKLKEHKLTHDKQVMPVLESKISDDEKKPSKSDLKKLWIGYDKKRSVPKVNEFPKRCQYCPKLFNTNGSYTNHMQMHERTKSRNVPIRESTRIRTPVLKQELKDEESEGESYQTCKRCFKVFSSKSTLRNHMKSHGVNTPPIHKPKKYNTKKVWCDVCHCAFENLAHLKRHKAEDHDEIIPHLAHEDDDDDVKSPFIFTCDICVQTFTSKMALKKHKERHDNDVKPIVRKQVYCKYCKIPFVNSHQLSIHMKEEHMEGTKEKLASKEKQLDFKCKICGKVFNSFSALNTHQGWHKRVRPENSTVVDKKIELLPIKEEPLETKGFRCNKCSITCPSDTALQIHILEKHRNINATVMMSRCSMCNLDFSSLEEYDQHKRFHAMVEKQPKKTYSCNQCPAAFSKLDVLKTHTRQFHTKQQGFKCHHCDRVFEKANSLGIHLKVHAKQKQSTGTPITIAPAPSPAPPTQPTPKKFTCSICSKGFDIPKELRTHTMQAHPF